MLKASPNFIKSLKKQKRENSSLLFLDNIKIIKDALAGGLVPQYLLVDDESKYSFDEKLYPIYKVDSKTIEMLSDCKTPQGVLCIAEYIPNIVEKPSTNFLVLDGLQDPGNVGTLIRTACACGFKFVYLVSSVKPTNSKVIRSSVGTIFNTKVISLSRDEFINKAKEWNLNLIGTDMNGTNVFDFKTEEMFGLIVGNEGQGISDQISKICKYLVKLPMMEGVESLNASISGAIIMYELSKDNF